MSLVEHVGFGVLQGSLLDPGSIIDIDGTESTAGEVGTVDGTSLTHQLQEGSVQSTGTKTENKQKTEVIF